MSPTHAATAADAPMVIRLNVQRRPDALRGAPSLSGLRQAAAQARASGDWSRARALLVRSLELRPDQEDALTELAQACVALGQDEEALAALGRLQRPDAPLAALLQGRALLGAGLHGPAVTVLDGLLRDLPGDVNLRVLLAEAQRRHGHESAERNLHVALSLSPGHLGARIVLGRLRLERGLAHEALTIALGGLDTATGQEAWELSLLAVDAELSLCRATQAEARIDQIPAPLQRAIPTIERRARLWAQQGRVIEARLELDAARATGGLSGAGHLALAGILLHMSEPEQAIEALSGATGLTAAEQPERDRLRGRALEALGDGRGAAASFSAARGGLRRAVGPRTTPSWGDAEAVEAAWPGRRLAGMHRAGDSGGAPIFVVGPPGSGVRLVGQLLAAQSERALGSGPCTISGALRRAKQRPDCDPCESLVATEPEGLRAIARRWWGAVPRDPDRPRVEAAPDNLLLLGFIAQLIPDARVVLVDRDPIDCALSAWSRWAPEHGDLEGIHELMEAGERARRLAEHWLRTSPLRIATLRYEALVHHPTQSLSRVRRALNLPPLPVGALLSGASPLRFGGPALDPQQVGRWMRYPALAESMDLCRRSPPGRPLRLPRAAS